MRIFALEILIIVQTPKTTQTLPVTTTNAAVIPPQVLSQETTPSMELSTPPMELPTPPVELPSQTPPVQQTKKGKAEQTGDESEEDEDEVFYCTFLPMIFFAVVYTASVQRRHCFNVG
jgi:hypothetical protein